MPKRRQTDCPKCGGAWYQDLDEEGKPYTCFYCCNGNIKFYMKHYAVAFISFFDNELTIEFVEAFDIMEAFSKHSQIAISYDAFEELREENEKDIVNPWTEEETLKHLKKYCFDGDAMIDIKEVPDMSTVRLEP
jgi:hypothetical protein